MNRGRTLWTLGVLLAIAAVASLVAIAAVDSDDAASTRSQDIDLGLIVLVNRLELTDEQILQLHGILDEMVSKRVAVREALEALRDTFEAEMIAFDGPTEELDALLEAHRGQIDALRQQLVDVRDGSVEALKETLTFEQGEILVRALPQLLGSRQAASPRGCSRAGAQAVMNGRTGGMSGRRVARGFAGAPVGDMARSRFGVEGRTCQDVKPLPLGSRPAVQGHERGDTLEMLIEILALKML